MHVPASVEMSECVPSQQGHQCGDSVDMLNGRPTGAVRVSFGYMSTGRDAQKFMDFIGACFLEKPVELEGVMPARADVMTLKVVFIL